MPHFEENKSDKESPSPVELRNNNNKLTRQRNKITCKGLIVSYIKVDFTRPKITD